MPFVCKICEKCPNSHSLVKFSETDEQVIYYTCPANATNNETKGIIEHYEGLLSELNGKNWIWILDLKGFEMKHFFEINNAVTLAKLITEKYSTNLQKIHVINTNSYTTTIFGIVQPFLNKRVRSMVVFSEKSSESKASLISSF
jgi:hypothetical protein